MPREACHRSLLEESFLYFSGRGAHREVAKEQCAKANEAGNAMALQT